MQIIPLLACYRYIVIAHFQHQSGLLRKMEVIIEGLVIRVKFNLILIDPQADKKKLAGILLLMFVAGNVVEAVRHARQIQREIRIAQSMNSSELYGYAKQLGVPLDLLQKTAKLGRLPVVNFAAGGLGKYGGTDVE